MIITLSKQLYLQETILNTNNLVITSSIPTEYK